jgi:ribosomal protein S18 acetylase RimI-like enzyme
MESALVYREAIAVDAAAIADLHADSWRRHYRFAYPASFFDSSLDEDRLAVWTERLSKPEGTHTLVAEQSGLVGFVHVVFDGDPEWGALVDNLHVRHDQQRSGIATHLMRSAAVEVVTAAPGVGLYLWVLEHNTRAQAFYDAIGGHPAGVRDVDPPACPGVRGIRYVWPDPSKLAP